MLKDLTIFHLDMDAFFASIEIVENPSLTGKPVIVGGHPDRRGVVATCSYEARAFGVKSAMSLMEAKKRCPQAIFLEGNFKLYREYSTAIMTILREATPFIEVVSVDEAYMDVTSFSHQSKESKKLGQYLRKKILQATSLTCSIGIASNKTVAKIASSMGKPNGLYQIPAGLEKDFLAPLPIQMLPGIGVKTQARLNQEGLKIIADAQALSLDKLISKYGARGYELYQSANGIDSRPVIWQEQLPKSIGAEITFQKDLSEKAPLAKILAELVEKACYSLCKHQMYTRAVSLKLRYNDFKTISRSVTLFSHTRHPGAILKALLKIFEESYLGYPPLRLLGISLEKLTNREWQPALWDWENHS